MSNDSVLSRAIHATARGTDPDATLAELLRLAAETADATAAVAFLWDSARGALVIAGSVGLGDGARGRYETAVTDERHPAYRAAREGTPVTGSPVADLDRAGLAAAWPITIARGGVDETIGALAVAGASSWSPKPEAAKRLASIADLIAVAIDRVRLASLVEERSDWFERVGNSDPLTGLANARTLARVVELEIARAARQGSELCVALFDVDGLADINRHAGRSAGDDVLREVAAVVTDSIRFVDTVARSGGDEFVLVAPGASGTTVVRRIVESVAARPQIAGRRFTVSAGVARFPADGMTGQDLMAAAEAALRAARAVGPGTLAEAVTGTSPAG